MRVAVVCPPSHELVSADAGFPPELDAARHGAREAEFVVGDDFDRDFKGRGPFDAAVLVPPGRADTLERVLGEARESKRAIQWIHVFFAGVERAAPALANPDVVGDAVLTNGRGAFSASLAEWVLAVVLHFNKQVPRLQQQKRERRWHPFFMDTVAGKTLGLVGYGSIAKATARHARALGMRVAAYRRTSAGEGGVGWVRRGHDDDEDPEFVGEEVDLAPTPQALYREADFVVSTLPATPDTVDFFNAAAFAAMRRGAVFVNVGRGTTVDEDALADALRSGKLAGAALDVFKREPLPESSPLWDLESLLVSPHNADRTRDYARLGWGVWLDNLAAAAEARRLGVSGRAALEGAEFARAARAGPLAKMTRFDPEAGY